MVVSRCGGLVKSKHPVQIGQHFQVIRQQHGEQAVARAVWVSADGEDSRALLAFEFLDCGNFWGLDWSVPEVAA